MRYFRLLLGVLVIAGTIWIIIGEQMSGASADAFVNARLATVRAPVAGRLTIPERPLGSSVGAGEELGTVADSLADAIRLNDLVMEEAIAEAELAAVRARLDTVDDQIEPLSLRLSAYTGARVAEIEARLAHARDRLALLESGTQVETNLSDLAAGAQLGEGSDPRLPGLALTYARERVAVLEIALDAARNGVFLGDGYNDAPYSEQRRAEMVTLRDGLAADVDLGSARLVAIKTRIAQEQVRASALGRAALIAPASGVIWEALAADGEVVQRGQDVWRLVDCGSVIVSLSVTESIYNSLQIGDAAVFRLSGDGRSFPATVLRLAGSGARTIYDNLAVAPSQKHLERHDVTLLVPALRDDPSLYCLVGRSGRVFFDRRPLDLVRNLWQ
ncbi:HlyD family secretion protein [Tabrizicola piscis]|uniref:HlyD family secretion protein n=1 Tax=Tabrizicola piscis TaxID=2494374 RepID=A0A3S8UAN9_9RHOB|nr:HlyD family secretion protein [Tabrizicola piscis]AZL60653.1 HlyD family secretion protein [Tabrizicola piscis]